MKKSVCLLCISMLSLKGYVQEVARIVLNQAGFYPTAPKIAVLISDVNISDFFILNVKNKDTVFKGSPGITKQSSNSSLKTQIADFTAFKVPGSYQLVIGKGQATVEFKIGPAVHRGLAVASLKAFYFQRVSMPLAEKYAGIWARNAGHPDTTVLIHSSAADAKKPAGTIISSPGGWYDAGDYNKYIVNSGITMGTLMSAYEDFKTFFDTLRVEIPESGNQIPDLLDEILYNLRWMLTMQDTNDGGVYHKCTNAAFDGNVMPGVTTLPRYAVQKSTAATLDFAAVMAQAARIFKEYRIKLPGLDDSCLKAAKSSWTWAIKNPAVLYNQDSLNTLFKPKITTGAYGDRMPDDEWFWAASELYITTGDGVYSDRVVAGLNSNLSLPSWAKVQMLGTYSLIRHQKKLKEKNKGITQNDRFLITQKIPVIEKALLKLADNYLASLNSSAFQTVMGGRKSDFNWGSNSNAANQGILMINAWMITRDKKYTRAALGNLDYLCGRNATGYCFITGMGNRSPMHPHHRPSTADGIVVPVPGLLAGGPNPGMQDKCRYDHTDPELAYTDDNCSYASNEIAINWNAPLVYLANAIEAVQGELFPVNGSK